MGSAALFLVALEVSVFGYLPGVSDPDRMIGIIWLVLLASLVLLNAAFAAAFARDLGAARSRDPT